MPGIDTLRGRPFLHTNPDGDHDDDGDYNDNNNDDDDDGDNSNKNDNDGGNSLAPMFLHHFPPIVRFLNIALFCKFYI